MKKRSFVLHALLGGAVHRKEHSVLASYLPPKDEYVVCVRLMPLQDKLYRHYIRTLAAEAEAHAAAEVGAEEEEEEGEALSCYAVLGVGAAATAAQLRDAYRGLARKLHPDKNGADPDANAKFQRLQAAHETLADSARRAAHDVREAQRAARPRPFAFSLFRNRMTTFICVSS